MIKKILPFFLILALEGVSYANCVRESEATSKSTCVVMQRDDARGVWFSLAKADMLRRSKLEIPELHIQIDKMKQMYDIESERTLLYESASKIQKDNIENIRKTLNESLQREEELKRKSNLWYKSPILWFCTGIVATTVTYLAIIFGAN